jgi:hypothetical protein
MDRRSFLLGLGCSVALAGHAAAATFQDAVVAQLRDQGYSDIVVERTLLGRIRIVAVLGDTRREIILNPRTGEVLRDVVFTSNGTAAPQIERASGSSSSGSSGSGSSGSSGSSDDDGGDDDGGDDDGSDDSGSNSGSGGSGSNGSGSSGSGGSGSSGSGSSGGSSHGSDSGDHEDEKDDE